MLSFNASSTITVTMHASPCKNPTVQTRETEEKGGIRRTKHWPPTLPAKAPAPTNRLARPLPFYHIQNSKWWQGLLISLSQIVSVLVMWKIRLCRPNEREPPYNRKKKKKRHLNTFGNNIRESNPARHDWCRTLLHYVPGIKVSKTYLTRLVYWDFAIVL